MVASATLQITLLAYEITLRQKQLRALLIVLNVKSGRVLGVDTSHSCL